MGKRVKCILLAVLLAVVFTGCMRTVDQMYRLPKRSEEFQELQLAIDQSMADMEYCAPLSGENQQVVQMADLNGDGTEEYLLFAKSDSERPLRIIIFAQAEDKFVLVQTIESNGSAFDQVEYVQMDDQSGVEVVFGSLLSDKVLRSVSVYTFSQDLKAELLVSTGYTRFLTVDLDEDQLHELFVLRPGQTETDYAVAELYGVEDGVMERSNEVSMSQSVDKLKRIVIGDLYGGQRAVYVASATDETSLITDVYTIVEGKLANVSLSNESGTSVKTLRNYYVYADDIDSDGIIELPALLPMRTLEETASTERHQLIRWYAMTPDGEEVDKQYTYHNLVGGWYLELNESWAPRLMVLNQGSNYEFYVWDEEFQISQRLLTVYVFTGDDRAEQATAEGRFLLCSTDKATYAAVLEPDAAVYGMTQKSVTDDFKLIQQVWKTGET